MTTPTDAPVTVRKEKSLVKISQSLLHKLAAWHSYGRPSTVISPQVLQP
jgi:hypothetical protein